MMARIRAVCESDAKQWWDLRLEALRNEPFAFGMAAEEHLATSVEMMAARIRRLPPGDFLLGAFEEDALVGTARFARHVPQKEKHKGSIYGFYVSEAHRGKRIGRGLMAELLQIAQQDPTLEQITLAVGHRQRSAMSLYQAFGFEVFGTEPRALKVDGNYIDELHMILRIR